MDSTLYETPKGFISVVMPPSFSLLPMFSEKQEPTESTEDVFLMRFPPGEKDTGVVHFILKKGDLTFIHYFYNLLNVPAAHQRGRRTISFLKK